MATIQIDQLKQGMVLSEDVRDISSRLLLKKGEPIRRRHIRVFKIWGVTEVDVESEQDDPSVSDDQRIRVDDEGLVREIKAIFRHVDTENPIIRELIEISLTYRAQALNGSPAKKDVIGNDKPPSHAGTSIKEEIIREIKSSKARLPELPSLISELNDIVNDPYASAEAIARVVNKSPSLAALLLKIVNSAFYGFSTKIDRISRAVTLVGVKEITSLAIGVSALRLFKDVPGDVVDVPSFFKHSFACGLVARMLAAHKNIQPPEQLFVSGLLHDIGRLVLLKHLPDRYRPLLEAARTASSPLYTLEKERLNCRHTDVAKYLIGNWKLPPSLSNTIYYHHRPSLARDVKRAAVVHLADVIVHGLGLGDSGETCIPVYDSDAVSEIGLMPSNLSLIIRQAMHQLKFLDAMFQQDALS